MRNKVENAFITDRNTHIQVNKEEREMQTTTSMEYLQGTCVAG